jgi:hypothetical protein
MSQTRQSRRADQRAKARSQPVAWTLPYSGEHGRSRQPVYLKSNWLAVAGTKTLDKRAIIMKRLVEAGRPGPIKVTQTK